MLPSTGAGAVNAMQDAVILANCLYDIKPTSYENIKEAFKEYKDQRYDFISQQYAQSHIAAKLQYGHVSALFRSQGLFKRKKNESEKMYDERVRS
jgi:2-polyprenyl-6-methoxyphenol hydroxylase-like FAD-dependent oxidoreductase